MTSNIYLLGYRDGCNDFSWCADFFKIKPPLNTKLSRKEVMNLGYEPLCGIGPKTIEPCDYYIAQQFGETS